MTEITIENYTLKRECHGLFALVLSIRDFSVCDFGALARITDDLQQHLNSLREIQFYIEKQFALNEKLKYNWHYVLDHTITLIGKVSNEIVTGKTTNTSSYLAQCN